MIKCEILSSSSKGNCIIVNDYIMLDCGLPYSKIKKYLDHVKIIFIGHSHSDHFNKTTIHKIAYEKPNIKFIVGNFMVANLVLAGVNKRNIITFDTGKWYDIGVFRVKMDYLFHDVPNNSLHIQFNNGEKLFYATDTCRIDHIKAPNYTLYLIEANYFTDAELIEKIKEEEEKGEYSYLRRVLTTHLSQLQALNWLDKNKSDESEFCFIHQHIDKEVKNVCLEEDSQTQQRRSF